MTMTAEGLGFKCDYQYQEYDDVILCTLTGRPCLGEYGGTKPRLPPVPKCLRERWAKEFEAKHGTSIFELDKRQPRDAAKSQELA